MNFPQAFQAVRAQLCVNFFTIYFVVSSIQRNYKNLKKMGPEKASGRVINQVGKIWSPQILVGPN